MKRLFSVILEIALLGLVCGCWNPGQIARESSGSHLVLSFDGLELGKKDISPRAFAPLNASIAKVHVKASGPNASVTEADLPRGQTANLDLSAGSWTVEAQGLSQSDIKLASGSLEVLLVQGEDKAATMTLQPISGSGSISLAWTIENIVNTGLRVEGRLSGPGGKTQDISADAAGTPLKVGDLPSGVWTLELRLSKDGKVLTGLADSILVLAGQETGANLVFSPTKVSLGLMLNLPDFSPRNLAVTPKIRRTAPGAEAVFTATPPAGEDGSRLRWYGNGSSLGLGGAALSFTPKSSAQLRLDAIAGPDSPNAESGSAELRVGNSFSLGGLSWLETLAKEDEALTSASYGKALGDPRALAFWGDSSLIAVAGKDSNAITVYSTLEGKAGSAFVASLDYSGESRLQSPDFLMFLDKNRLVAASALQGSVYALTLADHSLSMSEAQSDALLVQMAGFTKLPRPNGTAMLALGSQTNSIALVGFDGNGKLSPVKMLASKSDPGLGDLALPSCLAVSPKGDFVAMGSNGDDAIYIFSVSEPGPSLSLKSRLAGTAFTSLGTLSNPSDLAFSPDGSSLFVSSFYSRTLFRLDRDGSGAFAPVAAIKSGLGTASGFIYPKRLCISPGGQSLVMIGGGAEDGVVLFDIGAKGRLAFQSVVYPDSATGRVAAGDALPGKPLAIGYSTSGKLLAVASKDRLSLFSAP